MIIQKKNRLKFLIGSLGILMLFLTGCGSESDHMKAEARLAADGYRQSIRWSTITWRSSVMDVVYRQGIDMIAISSRINPKFFREDYFLDSAPAKRKIALVMGRDLYFYKLFNYQQEPSGNLTWNFLIATQMDGVSGLIYNAAYICTSPFKLLVTLRASCGFWNCIWNLLGLLLGVAAALLMLPLAPLLGTICHPFETFSNLFAGIFLWPPEGVSIFSGEYWTMWWDYLCNANLFASVWDLLWSAIVFPLLLPILLILFVAVALAILIFGPFAKQK